MRRIIFPSLAAIVSGWMVWRHNFRFGCHVEAFSSKSSNFLARRHGVSITTPIFKINDTCYVKGRSCYPSSAMEMSRWRGTEDVEGADVLKSCIPYLLPLLDGEHFGRYIYQQVPPLGFLDSLFVGPLYEFYARIPFLGLILFVALTLGTRMNTEMNWNVRFNAQQAALIDVALVFPELIGSAFEGEDMPRYIEAPCMNFVWYCYMSMILYSIWSNVVRKKRPDQIPWISAYATTMTGPI